MHPRFKPKITDIKEVSEANFNVNIIPENSRETSCTISRSTLVEAIQTLPNSSTNSMKHFRRLNVTKYEEGKGNTIKRILEIMNWKLGREAVSSNNFGLSCESLDIIYELMNSSVVTPQKAQVRTKKHSVSTQVDNDLISRGLLEDSLYYLRNAIID